MTRRLKADPNAAEAQRELAHQLEIEPAHPAPMTPPVLTAGQDVPVQASHRVVAISRGGARSALEVQTAVTHLDDGAQQGSVVVFKDVTREVRAQAESGRLAAIVESSSDAVVGKTLDGRITDGNLAAQALFGYSAEEAIGHPVQMLMPHDRQDEEMRILANLARGVHVPAFDTVRRTKAGKLIRVSVAISPIRRVTKAGCEPPAVTATSPSQSTLRRLRPRWVRMSKPRRTIGRAPSKRRLERQRSAPAPWRRGTRQPSR